MSVCPGTVVVGRTVSHAWPGICDSPGLLENLETAVVLHEDKDYFPSTSEVYPEAETLVQDEDTQPLTAPIINPLKRFNFEQLEKKPPTTSFSTEYVLARCARVALAVPRTRCLMRLGERVFAGSLRVCWITRSWCATWRLRVTCTTARQR